MAVPLSITNRVHFAGSRGFAVIVTSISLSNKVFHEDTLCQGIFSVAIATLGTSNVRPSVCLFVCLSVR